MNHLHRWLLPHRNNQYHPHLLRHRALSGVTLGAILLKLVVLVGLSVTVPSNTAFAEVVIEDIVRMTNQSRISNGLEPVRLQENLNQAAHLKAQDMVNQGYFNHYGPQGETPWQWFHAAGYRYVHAGENLASNFSDAETVHEAWMESLTHRANILNPHFRDMGLAVATGEVDGKKTTIIVELFGSTNIPLVEIAGTSISVNNTTETVNPDVFPEEQITVESENIVSTISEQTPSNAWVRASEFVREFYLFLAAGFALILMLAMGIRLEIQHHRAWAHTIAVIGVLLLLASMEIHFLEGLGNQVWVL